eukprot:gene10669-19418_t
MAQRAHDNLTGKISFSNLAEVDVKSFIGHEDEINCCAFSSDLKFMVTGSDDSVVKLWDVAENKVQHTLKGHSGPIKGCCFSPDNLKVASCAFDHKIVIWDAQTGTAITTLEDHSSSVESVEFSPCGQYLASGSWDKTGIVWNLKTRLPEVVIVGHQSVVQCCTFSLDGETLATGSWDKTVQTWNIRKDSNLENRVFKGHKSNIKAVAFSCQKILASASWDCTVRLWDIFKSTCLHILDERNFSYGDIRDEVHLNPMPVRAFVDDIVIAENNVSVLKNMIGAAESQMDEAGLQVKHEKCAVFYGRR